MVTVAQSAANYGATRTLTWIIARIHSRTLHQHSYHHTVRSASSAITFQCMLGLFVFP